MSSNSDKKEVFHEASLLPFGFADVDSLFPGFQSGNFAALYGSSECIWLSLLLCVRCQLPLEPKHRGFPALFIDGGNSFDLYEVSTIAKKYNAEPRNVLNNIFVSRAFTAYQLTSLIFERLKPAVDKFGAELVIISNAPSLYLDRDVPKTEAMDVFNKVTLFLSSFAAENKVIVVGTYARRQPKARTAFFEAALLGRANVIIKTTNPKGGLRLTLEKHPTYRLGTAELRSEGITLTEYLED